MDLLPSDTQLSNAGGGGGRGACEINADETLKHDRHQYRH